MTLSKFHPESLNAPEIHEVFSGLHAVDDTPTTVDELLGPREKGKLRRPRADQLTKLIDLTLPLKFNQLTQRIENDGEPIDGDFLGTLYIQLAEQFSVEVNKVRAQDAAMPTRVVTPITLFGTTSQASPLPWSLSNGNRSPKPSSGLMIQSPAFTYGGS